MTSYEKIYTIDIWNISGTDDAVITPVLTNIYGMLDHDDVDDLVLVWDNKTKSVCAQLGLNPLYIEYELGRLTCDDPEYQCNEYDHDPIWLSDHPQMLILLDKMFDAMYAKELEEYENFYKKKDSICEKKEASV